MFVLFSDHVQQVHKYKVTTYNDTTNTRIAAVPWNWFDLLFNTVRGNRMTLFNKIHPPQTIFKTVKAKLSYIETTHPEADAMTANRY